MSLILFCIVLIILYLYALYIDRKTYNNFITGFWKSDCAFCSEAEIDDMVLYINGNTDTGHLIITKDNSLIENSSFNIKKRILTNGNNLIPFNNVLGNQTIEYVFNFTPDENSKEFSWDDDDYILILSIINGTILIHKNGILFSKLYKDNSISNKFLEYAQIEETL